MSRVSNFSLLIAIVGGGTSVAQDVEKPVRHDIICTGSRDICVSWHNPESNIWHSKPGSWIYEDPYPWGMGSVCPGGSDSVDNIFIFDPGSATMGIGYIGCEVCANDQTGHYLLAAPLTAQKFTNFDDWVLAQSGGIH